MTRNLRLAGGAMAALAAVAFSTAAMARPDARSMTCEQTQRLIAQSRAVVLTTGQHTYERFVAPNGYCYHPEVVHITYIRTNDTNQCPVYHCEAPILPFDN